jgi:hypothetical protein
VIIFVANISPFCVENILAKTVYYKFPEFVSIARNDFLIYNFFHNCQQHETALLFLGAKFHRNAKKKNSVASNIPFFSEKNCQIVFKQKKKIENKSPHLKVEFSFNFGSIFLNDFF